MSKKTQSTGIDTRSSNAHADREKININPKAWMSEISISSQIQHLLHAHDKSIISTKEMETKLNVHFQKLADWEKVVIAMQLHDKQLITDEDIRIVLGIN